MKCKSPYRAGLVEGGCGQCLPCRINRQRLWTIRLVLEAGQHPVSHFVTLTYDADFLPSDGSVSVREAQLFLKRLRKAAGSFRYFLVGEYGERSWRPHYHALLFGVRDVGCVRSAWQKGFVHCSGVGPESAAYVAGYCLKGAQSAKGMRWHGRSLSPEFALMSRRPGIGASAAAQLVSFYSTKEGAQFQSNIRVVLRYQQKLWPLGRYLKMRVLDGLGIDREDLSRIRQLAQAEELQGYDQVELNHLVEVAEWKSFDTARKVEARVKRKSLERKI